MRVQTFLRLFIVAWLTACIEQKDDKMIVTYKSSAYASSKEVFGEAPPKRPVGIKINNDWFLDIKDTVSGLAPDVPLFDLNKKIRLPHRLLLPNSPVWYQKRVNLQKGVLILSADDGAQLWIDGVRVLNKKSNIFPVNQSSEESNVTIRVLNNAMHGGLRDVSFIGDSEWAAYQESLRSHKLTQLDQIKKHLLFDSTNAQTLNMNLMLTDPIWQKDNDNNYYITWTSDRGGEAVLIWGTDYEKMDNRLPVEEGYRDVFMTKMPDFSGEIYYQIMHEGTVSQVYTFEKKETSNKFKFAVWGDSQGGWDTFNQIANLIQVHQPDFSIGAGDLVNNGSDSTGYLYLMQALSSTKTVTYPVPGNHDYDGYYEDLYPMNYFKYLGIPNRRQYFSWVHGNSAFIALDPNMNFPVGIPKGSEQYVWFQEQINSDQWNNAEWHFIMLHQPPFSQGWPEYHGEQSILDLLSPHLEQEKIDVVISGHTHDYERLIKKYGDKEVAFLIVGGGGGGLEPSGLADWPEMDTVVKQHHYGVMTINNDELGFMAFNLKNELIDNMKLSHKNNNY